MARAFYVGKKMKLLAILAAFVGTLSGAALLWWNIADGTRFNRSMQDLLEFSPDEFKVQEEIDPWGNTYMVATSSSEQLYFDYVFSRGPDGQTESLGNDPDDITRWKESSEWLASVHRTVLAKWLIFLSVVSFTGSLSFLYGHSKDGQKKPNKAEMETSRKPSD